MKKKDLMKKQIKATPAMMKRAMNEQVKLKKAWYGRKKVKTYRNGAYAKAEYDNGILRVAIFFTEEMRKGKNIPEYELFIDPENKKFVTYNRTELKWQESMLDNLNWPDTVYRSEQRIFFMPQSRKVLSMHLFHGCYVDNKAAYNGIIRFQRDIRKETREEGYRREMASWDEDMKRIPPLPKDFKDWIDKYAIDEHYIFYQYDKNGTKEGYCTFCRQTVPVKDPRYGQKAHCKRCHKEITYKSTGKAGNFYTKAKLAYLIQTCKGGYCIRQFRAHRRYRKGEYENPEVSAHEIRRVIYENGNATSAYYWGQYKDGTLRFIKRKPYSGYAYWDKGLVYKKNMDRLEKGVLKRSSLPVFIKRNGRIDPETYLNAEKRNPHIEQIMKAGLYRLGEEYLTVGTPKEIHLNEKGRLDRILGIDKYRLSRLREMNGGKVALTWLQYEKEKNTEIDGELITFFAERDIKPHYLDKLLKYMTERKIYNYLKKQMEITGARMTSLIDTWIDYISMAKRLNMDLENPLVHRPKDLKKEHDRLIKVLKEKGLTLLAGEILERFGEVEDRLAEIKEKYEYSDKKYAIIVPDSVEDMLRESEALRLCFDQIDIYWDRIEQRESYLMWLRRKEDIDKPWYVLEVQPGGSVRQKRTLGDNQNDDFEEAVKFIKKWQKAIQKRMTPEDLALARESDLKREAEFKKLRKDGNRIHRGKLAGKLLVEVLEQDFMDIGGMEHVG